MDQRQRQVASAALIPELWSVHYEDALVTFGSAQITTVLLQAVLVCSEFGLTDIYWTLIRNMPGLCYIHSKKNKNKKVYQIWKTIGWKHQKLTRNQRHNSARIHSCLRLACVLPATGSYTLHHMREGWGKDFLHKHSLMTPHQASLPGWMLQPTWACGFSVFYLRLQATLRTVEHPGKWLV